MFGYGLLAVVLVLYLDAIDLSAGEIGLLLTLTLLGDAAISLWLTTHADRIGRRRVLLAGAVLLLAAGLVFVATPVFVVLLVAATIGVISPSGNEVGPFLAVEQASLSQLTDPTPPDGAVRALPARRRDRDGRRGGDRRAGGPGRGGPGRAAGRRLSGGDRRLCDRGRGAGAAVRRGVRGGGGAGRGAVGRDGGVAARAAPVPAGRAPAVGAVRARRLRRRVRHAELHRVLVPRAVRRGPGRARGDPRGRQPPRGGDPRWPRPRSPRGSASSTRWCSRTCRRTCC